MVVKVVVREREDVLGELKTLWSRSPPEVFAVLLVPAFDCAASEFKVSGLVASVGAFDLFELSGLCGP